MLLAPFDRMWLASELARRWADGRGPARDHLTEHRELEEAALDRDAELLTRHIMNTIFALTDEA